MSQQHSLPQPDDVQATQNVSSLAALRSPSVIGPRPLLAQGVADNRQVTTSASQSTSSGNIPLYDLDDRVRPRINSLRQSVGSTAPVNISSNRRIHLIHIYVALVSGHEGCPLVVYEHIADTSVSMGLLTELNGTFSINAISAMLLPTGPQFPEGLRQAREDSLTILATAQSMPAEFDRNVHNAILNGEVLYSIPRLEADRCSFVLILVNANSWSIDWQSVVNRMSSLYSSQLQGDPRTAVEDFADVDTSNHMSRYPSQLSFYQPSRSSETSYPQFTPAARPAQSGNTNLPLSRPSYLEPQRAGFTDDQEFSVSTSSGP
ncbi:hypothetical protein EV361DRAFT_874875, partial [Lentinula raphanica]